MKKVKIQVNYNKYDIIIPKNIYESIMYMDDLKHLKRRIKYSIKSGEYLRKKDTIFYDVHYIASALEYKDYSVMYDSKNNNFKVLDMLG